ncbi:MAG: DUF975 family protein [Ruminococcaceae bacterium]|nr:DUF975 family protein [Oscillospiraceae bacterium]
MAPQLIDRKQLKAEMKTLLADAQVSPKGITALYCALELAISMALAFAPAKGTASTFLSIFSTLLITVLFAGFVLYCMAVRRNERAEYLTLFDGFAFAGKLIGLALMISIRVALWSMVFVIPGIVTAYRYRFALYNLYENPGIGILQAMNMSRVQTIGYKAQLFSLDLSYIGWGLLTSLPIAVESGLLSMEITAAVLSGATQMPSEFALYSVLPGWGWVLLSGLWTLMVSMFYLPVKTCTELGYFEIAKQTSGVGFNPDAQSAGSNNEWDSD